MHKLYKSNDISCKNTFGVKKVRPGKLESYLEVNAWADLQQQDLISEYGEGVWHTGHIIINITLDTL